MGEKVVCKVILRDLVIVGINMSMFPPFVIPMLLYRLTIKGVHSLRLTIPAHIC